jgi:polyisoprenyl-phosphate glycosyltransferase
LFLGGIQLVSIGILGEYIGRIYEEVRERPRFIVDQAFGLDQSSVATPEQKRAVERPSQTETRVGSA